MDSSLTSKQQAVLDYIEDYQLEHGASPTLKEIRIHLKVSSDNSVLKHLDALERKGFVKRNETPRGIRLLQSVRERLQNPGIKLPLLGTIPAGNPTSIQDNTEEWVSIAESLVSHPKSSFLLKVRGDSMINAGINDGDLVVVSTHRQARNGDIVVALIDNENTVKRYIVESGRVYLKAENEKYPALFPLHELVIQGVVTGLLRSFS